MLNPRKALPYRAIVALSVFTVGAVVSIQSLSAQSHEQHDESKATFKTTGQSLVNFEDLSTGKDKIDPILSKLKATASIQNSQRAKEGGIKIFLRIQNTGESSVTLANPLDSLSIRMTDENGNLIRLPNKISRRQVNSIAGAPPPPRPFKVLSANLGGQQLKPNELEAFKFLIPSGKTLEIQVMSDRVLNDANQEVAISAGKYLVTAKVFLIDATKRHVNRQVITQALPITLTD